MVNKIKIAGQKSKAFVCLAIFLLIVILNLYVFVGRASRDEHDITVVVDAGHGGMDPGKVSASGINEKDVNLSIAIFLKEMLEKEGINVVMTRENDNSLCTEGASNKKSSDMNNRIEKINEANADCLISIHQNSFTDTSVSGAQVFYYSESQEAKKLAEEIQETIKNDVSPENNRSIKSGNDYFILRKSVCPGVIVECGFLSNKEETAKLIDKGYQQRIAKAIAKAVCQVYKNDKKIKNKK